MLNYFTEKKKSKQHQLSKDSFDMGIELLKQKKYSQATIKFEESVKHEKETGLLLLGPKFDEYDKQKLLKESVAVGDVLYQHQKKTYQFTNHLGNLTRLSGNNRKANELYKRAISLNKQDDTAFYNLAASISKVPIYDHDIKPLIKKHIGLSEFLLPKSDYPRDVTILGHLTKTLNRKHFFKKVEKMQEMILEKELRETTSAIANTDHLMANIRKKMIGESKIEESCTDVVVLLQESLKHNWISISTDDKDEFLWNILHLGLYVLNERDKLTASDHSDEEENISIKNLQLALDIFVKLKTEQYSFRYLNMVIAISQFMLSENGGSNESGSDVQGFKDILSSDPNDRYFNINMGIFYHRIGNKLMSLVFLIKGASIIDKLDGACHLSDIISLADIKYSQGQLNEALKLYRLASLETDNVELLSGIGKTLISLNKYYEAIQPLKEARRLDPNYEEAQNELLKLQEHFCFMADEFYQVGTYVPASDNYEHALEIDRTPHIILKAMQAYKMQGNHKKEYSLKEEYNAIKTNLRQQDQEVARKQLIVQGKNQLKQKDLNKAISLFEKAFKIKTDKDTFMYLVYLYKKLNQKNALVKVVQRWREEHPNN